MNTSPDPINIPHEHRVLVLRTNKPNMSGTHARAQHFIWPDHGPVSAPDWDPEPRCGYGLHGLLKGEGALGLLCPDNPTLLWLVVEVDQRKIVTLDENEKVKFPEGNVIFVGTREEACAMVKKHHPEAVVPFCSHHVGDRQHALVGECGTATAGNDGTATAGDYGTATAGDYGTATAGDYGTATAGDYGTATAGNRGTAIAGYGGTATAGHGGTATAGNDGTAIAGYGGTATAGYDGTATVGNRGTATVGNRGTATAGPGGILQITYWKNNRKRIAVAYVGEDGILPNTPYKYNPERGFYPSQN